MIGLTAMPLILSLISFRPDVAKAGPHQDSMFDVLHAAISVEDSSWLPRGPRPPLNLRPFEQEAIANIRQLGGSVQIEQLESNLTPAAINMIYRFTQAGERIDNPYSGSGATHAILN